MLTFLFTMKLIMPTLIRWPVFVIRSAISKGHATLQPVWRKIAWSFNVLHDGVHPFCDENGLPFPVGTPEHDLQGKLIGGEAHSMFGKASLVMMRADWAWIEEMWNSKFTFKANQLCIRCKATKNPGPYSFEHFGASGGWNRTHRSTAEFITEALPKFAPCKKLSARTRS